MFYGINLPMNKDKAKVVLAHHAVERLASIDESAVGDTLWTMRELFAATSERERENPLLLKAGKQKTWQRSFIDRLVENELVERVKDNHHVSYTAYDSESKKVLQQIVDEGPAEEPGPTIKWLVFPHNYDTPEMFAVEEEDPTPEPTTDVGVESLKLLSSIAETIVGVLEAQKKMNERIDALHHQVTAAVVKSNHTSELLKKLPDAIGDSAQVVHDRSIEKIEQGVDMKLDAMKDALSGVIAECRKLSSSVGVAQKVTHLHAQFATWNRIIQAVHVQNKNFEAGIETVLDAVGALEENAAESARRVPQDSGQPD